MKEGCIPEDWKSIVILPIYKGKCDPMECGSYRWIKLSEHAMKVVQRIFEHRIWQQIEVDDMQFGFMKGKGSTDAIFTLRLVQEKFRVKGKKLYFGFVDLESVILPIYKPTVPSSVPNFTPKSQKNLKIGL